MISSKFNQSANNLPENITHLTFGWDFNQEINDLPSSIIDLTFSNNFNKNVSNLPKNISRIKLINNNYLTKKDFEKYNCDVLFEN